MMIWTPLFALAVFGVALEIGDMVADINQIKREWKIVLVAAGTLVGIGLICLTLGVAVFGKEYALSAAGHIARGLVATIIIQNAANAAGQDMFGAFAMLVFAFQVFAGMPIAAYTIKKEGNRLKKRTDSWWPRPRLPQRS